MRQINVGLDLPQGLEFADQEQWLIGVLEHLWRRVKPDAIAGFPTRLSGRTIRPLRGGQVRRRRKLDLLPGLGFRQRLGCRGDRRELLGQRLGLGDMRLATFGRRID